MRSLLRAVVGKLPNFLLFSLFLFPLSGCKEPKGEGLRCDQIAGRGAKNSPIRPILYQAKVPPDWARKDPERDALLSDTRLALCEYFIGEGKEEIRITVHNFPVSQEGEKIPPAAQISRWKTQFEEADLTRQIVSPETFSGYFGLFYEGRGVLEGKESLVLGWALQIDPEHSRTLAALARRAEVSEEKEKSISLQQMSADVTIKAVGPLSLMQKRKEEIAQFARSFALIEEIPSE